MTEIRKDSERTETSPFQEEPLLENYFACGNRDEVLSQMKEAVEEGASLIILTGEEGSGKTMMCRLLEHEVSCRTIFFSRTVDSFEEVVRTLANDLGLDDAIEMDSRWVDQSLDQVTEFLLGESVDLLLIFDEAENIFLATLERIRKMMDRMNGAGVRMHVLFSGRKTLLENCEQLSLCDFQNGDDFHFALTPLTESETADYLYNCAARLTDIEAENVFTDAFISKIYALAQGNFRKINILGEESVKPHCDDTSFMVLLEGVKEGVETGHPNSKKTVYLQFLQRFKAYLPWIGGAVGCLLLLFLLFRSGGEEGDGNTDIAEVKKVEQLEQQTTVQEETSYQLSEKKELGTMALVEELQPPEEEEIAGAGTEKENPVPAEQEKVVLPPSAATSSQQNIDKMVREAEKIAAEKNGKIETVETAEKINNAAASERIETKIDAVDKKLPEPDSTQGMEKVDPFSPAVGLNKKQEPSPTLSREKITVQPEKKVRKVVVPRSHTPGDLLYNERLAAGFGWKNPEKRNMYTVQIMALASKTAEMNLKKMLAQVNYRQEAGNFYIFDKVTAPESVFVFYGEYPTIERARLARDSLPQFLRDHKPYVLSIKGAIGKVGN